MNLPRLSVLCGLFLLLLFPLSLAADIVINEIHYAPPDKTVPEEYVEIINTGESRVDLSGWTITGGIDYLFPQGISIDPGEYLVIALNPDILTSLYGDVNAIGPFIGRLDNDGETIVLRDAAGLRMDRVDYRCGFPWPTIDKETGLSMELIHPSLDNELGANWRISDPGIQSSSSFVTKGAQWRYFKGTEEASSPRSAWRGLGFTPDAAWGTGNLSIGYGEDFITTPLNDMRNNYSSVFLRKTFDVEDLASVGNLLLQVQYDDGFNAWINGTHVAGGNMPSEDPPHDETANSALEEHDFIDFSLPRPVSDYLVEGTNVLAIQLHNATIGNSSDAFLDAALIKSSGAGSGPTPGQQNTSYSTAVPPRLRQLTCLPEQPVSGEPVLITIKATDDTGVSDVTLEYQAVAPGSYIEITDAEYAAQWTGIAMNDDGTGGDAAAGDAIFSVTMPAAAVQHRHLIRYRIKATDSDGLEVTVPYADDPQPNFAYFVYDGIPGWEGAINPSSSNATLRQMVSYPASLMGDLPCYFLITKQSDAEDAHWYSKYGGSDYRWTGTLVYDGKVYDHIRYRMRGGVWRYAMGKNMWKFDFNRSHYFQARDPYGKQYDTTWDKLNFSALIQQGNYLHRGEQGLFEGVGFTFFNMVGVEAPKVHYVTYRVIDEADEFGQDQYGGDFWGLYMVIEQMDGRFLDEHDLPDGNLYKMEGGSGTLNNLGVTGVQDRSDLNQFMNAYESNPSESWWENNLDLDRYYSYRSIVEGIHHYDIAYGKNYFYYLNPETNVWSVLPWDLDLTWANNMYGNGNHLFKQYVLSHSRLNLQYQNRMREIMDLLYNNDQAYQLIDEFAAMVNDPQGGISMVDADRAKWDYNPVMVNTSLINSSKAGHGRFYESGSPETFEGMVQLVKNYVISRGNWMKSTILTDDDHPNTPTVNYTGDNGFPVDGLSFSCSSFSDPQGSGTFEAMQWRIGEVALPGAPDFDPLTPRPYEINAVWESPYSQSFQDSLALTPWLLKVGHRYRVRVRMQDTTFRWSHWSNPVEFTVAPPSTPFPQVDSLRITEIMYHPINGSDFEFIELQNVGQESIDLTPVSFTDGIDFDFAEGDITELAPGEYVVLVKERGAFESLYDTSAMLIAGEYGGRLENLGEPITLTCGANTHILSFQYGNAWEPTTDGQGHSLTIVDPSADAQSWQDAASWMPSSEPGGTPGRDDDGGVPGGRQRVGDLNQDNSLDLSDAVAMLMLLFGDDPMSLPCEGTEVTEGGNRVVLDLNDDSNVDLADIIYLLTYLFDDGPDPVQGLDCIRIEGCPNACL